MFFYCDENSSKIINLKKYKKSFKSLVAKSKTVGRGKISGIKRNRGVEDFEGGTKKLEK